MVERWERWEWYKHIASLLLLLLLLLIVIYDGVGTYNEMTIVDWYVDVDIDDDVELCQSICWICYYVGAHSFPQWKLLHSHSKRLCILMVGVTDMYLSIYIYIYIGTIHLSCWHANMYSCCLVVTYVYAMSGAICYVPNGNNIINIGVVCWLLNV